MIFPTCTDTAYVCCVATYRKTLFCVLELFDRIYRIVLVLLKIFYVIYVNMDTTCCDDDLDRDDSKGRIRAGFIARLRTWVNGVDTFVHRDRYTRLRREPS